MTTVNKSCNCPDKKKAQIDELVMAYIKNEKNEAIRKDILHLFDHCEVCKEHFMDETLFLECIRKNYPRNSISDNTALKIRSSILTFCAQND